MTYRLPAERSSAHVSVSREVRRSGALQLHQSVIAFPDSEPFRHTVARIRAAVDEVGGTALQRHAQTMAEGYLQQHRPRGITPRHADIVMSNVEITASSIDQAQRNHGSRRGCAAPRAATAQA